MRKKPGLTMKDIHIYMENRIFLCSVKMGRNFMQLYIYDEPTRASRHFRANYIWKGFWKDAGRMDYRKMRFKKLSIRPEKK